MRKVPEHGTANRYDHYKCRCAECKKANNDRLKDYIERRKASSSPIKTHGVSGYSFGCRCQICKTAYSKSIKQCRLRLRDMNKCPHGTQNGYVNYGCRCDDCKRVQSEIQKTERRKRLGMPLPPDRHGTDSSYCNYGCRCDLCKLAHTEKARTTRIARNASRPPRAKQVEPPKVIKVKTLKVVKIRTPKIAEHGTTAKYSQGCRCDNCRMANAVFHREYNKTYHKSENEKIARRLRSRLGAALKGRCKVGSAVRDLGCSIDEFRTHLEKQFLNGMTWDNYGCKPGQWSIDHIIPLNTFDLTDREQFLKACHYTNMRPLWHLDNMRRPDDGSDVLAKQ